MPRGSANGSALMVDPLAESDRTLITFHGHVDHDNDGCWTWTGYKNQQGYGRMFVRDDSGKQRLTAAHRLSYRHFVGPIPAGAVIMHDCDNPQCVNPGHLYLGTQQDNMRDMIAKGRNR